MTNQEINDELGREIKSERKTTNRILKLIILAEDRKIHLERGYSTLHRWLVEEHKYSASAANRRIQAARLLRAVPAVENKIESGAVNLTTLAQAQSMIRTQETMSKQKVSSEMKQEVVSKIENLNSLEAEQSLMSLLPENISAVKRDKVTAIDSQTQRLATNLSNKAMADLKRAREILSHAIPSGDSGEILARALAEFVEHNDPLKKAPAKAKGSDRAASENAEPKSAAVSHRATRTTVIQMGQGSCTYKDPKTGHVCGEKFRIERDHIIPKAQGGDDSLANARTLCRAHNQFMSEKILGKKTAHHWRNKRPQKPQMQDLR